MEVKLLFLVLFACVIGAQAKLAISSPGTLYVSGMEFEQQLKCEDEQSRNVDCNIQIIGLPKWMLVENGTLKMNNPPIRDSIQRIIIIGERNGERATRIIVLYVDYNYQANKVTQTNNSTEVIEKITKNEDTLIRQNEMVSQITLDGVSVSTKISKVKFQTEETEEQSLTKEEKEQMKKRYEELLARQAKAHQRVAYYLTQLAMENQHLSKMSKTIETLITEQKQIRIHLDILIQEVEIWKKNNISQEKQINQQKQSLKIISEEINKLVSQLNKKKIQFQNSKKISKKLKEDVQKLNLSIERMQKQVEDLKNQLKNHEQLCDRVEKQRKKVEKDIQNERNKERESKEKITSLEENSEKYQLEIQQLRSKLEKVERLKKQADKNLESQRQSLKSVQEKIRENQVNLKQIEQQCDQSMSKQLNDQIEGIKDKIISFLQERRKKNSNIQVQELSANSTQIRIQSFEREIRTKQEEKNKIELRINSLKRGIKDIETKIYRINVDIQETQEEFTQISEQIRVRENNSSKLEGSLKALNKELEDALIEKQLIDGHIKKVLLGENSIIEQLGLAEIFYSQTDIPQNYNDLASIQKHLQGTSQLHKVKLISGRNLKEEDWEECEEIDRASVYGSGHIEEINQNEFTVRSSEGEIHRLKVFACSLNLSPNSPYAPEVGDLICWRAFTYDNYEVVIESLLFNS